MYKSEDYAPAFTEVARAIVESYFSRFPNSDQALLADNTYVVQIETRACDHAGSEYPLIEVTAFRDHLEQGFIQAGATSIEMPLVIGGRVKDTKRRHLLQVLVVLPDHERGYDHFQEACFAMLDNEHVLKCGSHSLAYTGESIMQALTPMIDYQAKSWLVDDDTFTIKLGNSASVETQEPPLKSGKPDAEVAVASPA